MDDSLIKRLMSTLKCSVCGQPYQVENIRLLGRRDELWFLSISCPSCHSQGLVAAVIKEGKPLEIITDLSEAELARLGERATVGADDVLDVHGFLKGFDGDFSRLFPNE